MDTNALLSFAFSLISAFTNVVQVPQGFVPRDTNDLALYTIGPPIICPWDVYLRHKRGTEFWVQYGIVHSEELQDPWIIGHAAEPQ